MKFERPKGFFSGMPKDWIDKSLPVCPLCRKSPVWEMTTKYSMVDDRYYFRCPLCMAILSVPSGYIAGILVKINSILKIEDVGNNQDMKEYTGKQIFLEDLQQMAKGIKIQPRPTEKGPTVLDRSIVIFLGFIITIAGLILVFHEEYSIHPYRIVGMIALLIAFVTIVIGYAIPKKLEHTKDSLE